MAGDEAIQAEIRSLHSDVQAHRHISEGTAEKVSKIFALLSAMQEHMKNQDKQIEKLQDDIDGDKGLRGRVRSLEDTRTEEKGARYVIGAIFGALGGIAIFLVQRVFGPK